MSIKLSVTVVAYNNYNDIKEMIKTLEQYTGNEISKLIYVIDNGASVCEKNEVEDFLKFISQYEDVKYIDTKQNLGFGKGHNYVLSEIESEFHAILNPDIIFIEDTFSKIIHYMRQEKNVGMCIPCIVDEEGNRQLVYRKELTVFDMFVRMFCRKIFQKRYEQHTMHDEDFSRPFQVPFGQGSFLVVRTELFRKIGGFDDGYFMYLEDADLCKRINQESKFMFYPYTKVIHKWEKGSHKNGRLFRYHIKSMVYYFNKWGWKLF